MNRFERLSVFQESHKLTLLTYKLVKKFPKHEQFIIINQLLRACTSVSANIIEGNSRGHKKEFLQFLRIAYGSLEETKYFLLLSKDLGYVTNVEYEEIQEQTELIGRLLMGLINSIKFPRS